MKKIITLLIVFAGIFCASCSEETFYYNGPAQVAFAEVSYTRTIASTPQVNIPVQLISSDAMSELTIGVTVVTAQTTVTGVSVPPTVTIPAGQYSATLSFNVPDGTAPGKLVLALSSTAVKVSGTYGTTTITLQ